MRALAYGNVYLQVTLAQYFVFYTMLGNICLSNI